MKFHTLARGPSLRGSSATNKPAVRLSRLSSTNWTHIDEERRRCLRLNANGERLIWIEAAVVDIGACGLIGDGADGRWRPPVSQGPMPPGAFTSAGRFSPLGPVGIHFTPQQLADAPFSRASWIGGHGTEP
jgi:hypothetical protein